MKQVVPVERIGAFQAHTLAARDIRLDRAHCQKSTDYSIFGFHFFGVP